MSVRFFWFTRRLFSHWARRLLRARGWVALQFVSLALLLLAGIGWTRIPEKHALQVFFTLLIPILLAAGFLMLQAATMRSFLRPLAQEQSAAPRQVRIAWGAATLLLWIAIAWLLWGALDRSDDRIELWSGYLNSKFGAGARAHIATEAHIAWLLNYVERALRWVILPGLLLPRMSSAAWGLGEPPGKRVLRVWLNWRWWPAVLVAALIGVAWPQSLFAALPHGAVSAQIWRVVLKLAASYLLVVASWLALMAWAATLICTAGPAAGGRDDEPGDLMGVGVRVIPPKGGKSGSVRLPLPEDGDDAVGNSGS
jgi:hypothetical protein